MTGHLSRRGFLETSSCLVAAGWARNSPAGEQADPVAKFETSTFEFSLGADATCLSFRDRRDGRSDLTADRPHFARARVKGRDVPASAARFENDRLHLEFGATGLHVVLKAFSRGRFLALEIESCTGGPVEELAFVDLPLSLSGKADEPFAICALARNVRTNVPQLPQPTGHLQAIAYPELGLVGASVAIVGSPREDFRAALQEAVEAAPDLPHSRLGGPWALDAPINRGSYLFNFDGVTEKNVASWIELAHRLGMTQIDFHGGQSFRFGDCRPNPTAYPNGRASLKAAIDQLHTAGISAGLHTYAFFLAKDTPWVTPVPDARLAAARHFTLTSGLDASTTSVPVDEPTEGLSSIVGFFVRNSATLRVGDELIVFHGVNAQAPFAFTKCERGALGTKASAHPKGTPVAQLKECFGLFVPDPNTSLLAEVAALTAETYNECGFDMIYLDALDGSDVLDPYRGGAFAWHYAARFALEIAQRLQRPAVFEMSTFSHHLWYIRSRYQAWDHPNRSYKRFIDLHCSANEESGRMFLPGELGWWALKSWTGAKAEPTFVDDIEYLMAKGLATNTGFALMGIDPTSITSVPALPRLADVIRRWEGLRHSGRVPASVQDRLREPGAEFTLESDGDAGHRLHPLECHKNRVEITDERTHTWRVENRFGPQPLSVRIEALMGAGPHDAPKNPVLAALQVATDLSFRGAQAGVTAKWEPVRDVTKQGPASGRFTLTSTVADRTAAWAQFEKTFEPPLDLKQYQGLGFWVHGDGSGALLNLQLRSPTHLVSGIADHYTRLDFEGWRYVELIEPEGERWALYHWPYGNAYSIYRELLEYAQVASLGIWFNDLPPGRTVTCHLEAVRAVPLVSSKLVDPTIRVGGTTLKFPCTIESGAYLEFQPPGPARLYGPRGELLSEVQPEGTVPALEAGGHEVQFGCASPARARVTIFTRGEPLNV